MSYLNHGEWESIKASLELQPLSAWAPDVVSRLLAGEQFQFPSELSYEQAVLQRLFDLELVEYAAFDDWEESEEVEAAPSLKALEDRGLVDELFDARALA